MIWLRQKRLRRISAGFALAATVLHVAFVSLHVAAMASLVFSGQANAASQSLGFILCGPTRLAAAGDQFEPAPGSFDNADIDNVQPQKTATFCPVCTGAVSPALIIPEQPYVPAYAAVFSAPLTLVTATTLIIHRFETERKISRGPPLST